MGQGWPRAWWAVKWGEIRLRILRPMVGIVAPSLAWESRPASVAAAAARGALSTAVAPSPRPIPPKVPSEARCGALGGTFEGGFAGALRAPHLLTTKSARIVNKRGKTKQNRSDSEQKKGKEGKKKGNRRNRRNRPKKAVFVTHNTQHTGFSQPSAGDTTSVAHQNIVVLYV